MKKLNLICLLLLLSLTTYAQSSKEVFQGALDDIRVYDRVLTQTEISYLATH